MGKAQVGRTMIETLAVLAIGAMVLYAGFASFLMAMQRHHANQILDYVNRCAVLAQTNYDGYVVEEAQDTRCGTFLSDEPPCNLNGMEFIISNATGNNLTYSITTPYIKSKQIRKALIDRTTTMLNGEVIDIWDFQGKVEFTFSRH